MGTNARAGLAAKTHDQLQRARDRRSSRTKTSLPTAGPTSSATSAASRSASPMAINAGADGRDGRTGGLPENGTGARASGSVVRDPDTAAALKPYYRQFCKRPCFHDEYLQTFNRPNVKLVDTQGSRCRPHHRERSCRKRQSVRSRLHHLATGFEVGTDYTRRAGYEMIGRDGETLTRSGRTACHVPRFPVAWLSQLFFHGGDAGSGFTANFPHMLNEQSRHIAYIVKQAMSRQARVVEPLQGRKPIGLRRSIG